MGTAFETGIAISISEEVGPSKMDCYTESKESVDEASMELAQMLTMWQA